MTDTHFDTIVVGGGLAGLVAAAHASAGGRTLLLEPHAIGGRAHTDERDGFTFNRGPRALYLGGPAERELRALGVDTTASAAPITKEGQLWDRGKLHLGPFDPVSALRTSYFSAGEKLALSRLLLKVRRQRPADAAGTSVTSWLDAEGASGKVRAVFEALVRVATYSNAPDVLDAGAAIGNLQLATGHGVRYLDGGFQALVDGLLAALAARQVEVDHRAAAAAGPGVVTTTDGAILTATTVVLAAGTPEATATLLGTRPWGELGPPAAAACLELGLRRVPVVRFAPGVDVPTYYSVHSPPARLAPEGGAVLHVMRYLAPGEHLSSGEVKSGLQAMARAAGVADDDIVAERFLARMIVSGAMPIASAGGLRGRPAVTAYGDPGVLIAGDWVGDEGMLSDAAIASGAVAGKAAARAATRTGTLVP